MTLAAPTATAAPLRSGISELHAFVARLAARDAETYPSAPLPAGTKGAALGHDTKSATPPPPTKGRDGAQRARRERYKLRESLGKTSPYDRMRKCGRCRIEDSVGVVRRADGSAGLTGLARCGSVWACPVCAPPIMAERAEELGRLGTWAVEQGYHVAMMTLTIRHGWTDDSDETLRGVARAYSRLCSGAPWARFVGRVGLVGAVRGLEATHGKNGWHPHIHALLLVRNEDALWSEGYDWLSARWADVVTRELGEACRPSEAHGCVLTVAAHADYVAKMGLDMREVGGSAAKTAAVGHRTPWQIATAAAAGCHDSMRLWRSYEHATHGRRQLVWSRGLRALSGAEEQSDRALLERAEERGAGVEVARLGASDWQWVLSRRAVCALLDAAESGSAADLERAIRGRPPDTPDG